MRNSCCCLALFSVFVLAPAATGQTEPPDAARFQVGASLAGGVPTGEFADDVDELFGIGSHALYRVGPNRNVGIRLDATWLIHGSDTREVALASPVGGLEDVDLTTTHSITFLGFGPEISGEVGGSRPYVGASAGIAYFLTDAYADWSEDEVRFSTRVAHEDLAFAYAAQAGILIPVTAGRWRASIDFGARYQGSEAAAFLDEEDVEVTPLGRIDLDPVVAKASLWVFHAGVAFGVGR